MLFVLATALCIGIVFGAYFDDFALDDDIVFNNEAVVNAIVPDGHWLDTGNFDPDWRTNVEGTGTALDPYIIRHAEQLAGLAFTINGGSGNTGAVTTTTDPTRIMQSNSGAALINENEILLHGVHILLDADIDLTAHAWVAIGGHTRLFRGIFDGNGHTVTLPRILRAHVGPLTGGSDRGYGLFGGLGSFSGAAPAVVRNLIVNGDVDTFERSGSGVSTSPGIGAIAGHTAGAARIENVGSRVNFSGLNISSVLSNPRVAGIVGVHLPSAALATPASNRILHINHAVNHGNISGISDTAATHARAAGIIGMSATNASFNLINVANYGNITANIIDAAAGIAGLIRAGGSGGDNIRNFYNRGDISVSTFSGTGTANTGGVGGAVGGAMTVAAANNPSVMNGYNLGFISGPSAPAVSADRIRQIFGSPSSIGGATVSGSTIEHVFGAANRGVITAGGGSAATRGFFNTDGVITTGNSSGQSLEISINSRRGINSVNANSIFSGLEHPLWYDHMLQINEDGTIGLNLFPTFLRPLEDINPFSLRMMDDSEFIVWEPVSYAAGYAVFANGQYVETVPDSYFRPRLLFAHLLDNESRFEIDIFPVGDGIFRSNSFGFVSLPEPVHLFDALDGVELCVAIADSYILSWNTVAGALGYIINIDNVQAAIVGGTDTYDLTHIFLALEPRTYEIIVVAYTNDGVEDYLNILTFSAPLRFRHYVQLATPQTTIDGNIISWEAVEHADFYTAYINGSHIGRSVYETSIIVIDYITLLTVGANEITVRAWSNNEYRLTSELSYEVTYIHTVRLDAPVIAISAPELRVIIWEPISYATGYEILVNGYVVYTVGEAVTVTLNSHLDLGYNTITIRAISDNIYRPTSVDSNEILILITTQLDSPNNFRLDDDSLHWDSVAGANGYLLTINGEQVVLAADATSHMVVLDLNINLFSIIAIGGGAVLDSEPVEINQLAAPGVVLEGRIINWDMVDYADEYIIYINGEEIVRTNETSFRLLSEHLSLGMNTIRVRARNTDGDRMTSMLSGEKTLTRTNIYRIVSDGNGLFSSYAVYSIADPEDFAYVAIRGVFLLEVLNRINEYAGGLSIVLIFG